MKLVTNGFEGMSADIRRGILLGITDFVDRLPAPFVGSVETVTVGPVPGGLKIKAVVNVPVLERAPTNGSRTAQLEMESEFLYSGCKTNEIAKNLWTELARGFRSMIKDHFAFTTGQARSLKGVLEEFDRNFRAS